VVEAVARRHELSWSEEDGPVAVARLRAEAVLLEPLSFVNRSGEALRAWAGEGLDASEWLVIVDDLALDPGQLRLRLSGGAGGHNGLASLLDAFGTRAFARLRLGIGGVPPAEWKEHVLGRPCDAEAAALIEARRRAVEAAELWLGGERPERLATIVNTASPPSARRRTDSRGDAARAALADRTGGRDPKQEACDMESSNRYEGMLLFPSSGMGAEGGKPLESAKALLEKHGARIEQIDVWDERKLAYPVDKHKRGIYVLAFFEAGSEAIAAITYDVSLSEEILRWMPSRLHVEEWPEFPRRKRREEGEEGGRGRDDDDRDRGRRGDGERRGPRPDREGKPTGKGEKPAAEAEKPAAEEAKPAAEAEKPAAEEAKPAAEAEKPAAEEAKPASEEAPAAEEKPSEKASEDGDAKDPEKTA
jgi:PTH1 family peptidyl-tRNA hydrolase